ncbi:YfkD family protein [Alkalihalobacillus sp. MEB130]|uniref:YfkD famly protein n=1 Tax=Alkalihalobacillus sp. MEB130 TaxID=2976704 RepID=UPI0028DEA0A0|nr:YfkD family protein [Alkalihalobacillus sp. MEB130]MDT8860952.1 YfkD family protein [Alkalihalobacillus sp. MEB130]
MKRVVVALFAILLLAASGNVFAEGEGKKEEEKGFKIPDSVVKISKENTYTNPTQDLPYLQPSTLAKELLDSADVPIENPDLIRILNESTINDSKLALGFRASIYLGEWPLAYESDGTEVNWEYQKVNTNYADNRGGRSPQKLTYNQEQQKKVNGGLTAKIPNSEAVKKMMMIKATEHTSLPLSFETVIGQGTRKNNTYNVAPKQVGYLHSYVPAANEKGKVTYGEVYLTFKGGKRKLEVKNVTQQGIGAWIPIQDHLSFTFVAANQPK